MRAVARVARLSRRGRIGLAVAVVVAVGAGGVLVARSGGGRSIEATVEGFFAARRAGDCERLLDYLDEASWSEGGRLGRREFVTRCEEVVDGYRPELTGVEVVSETGGAAVVQMATPVPDLRLPRPVVGDRPQGMVVRAPMLPDDERAGLGVDAAYERGELVRDGATWRVRLDPRYLRVGRSVEQTVTGYLRAYREGECGEATGFVRDGAGPGGPEGARRQDFVQRCQAVAERTAASRRSLPDDPTAETTVEDPQVVALPVAVDLTSVRADRVTAEVRWNGGVAQTVRLVRRDLTWHLTDPAVEAVRFAQLSAALPRESDVGLGPGAVAAVRTGGPAAPYDPGPAGYEGGDAAERRQEHGFEAGLTISFGSTPRGLDVLVYEFGDADGARGYAEHLGQRIAADATRYQELTPVGVPGVDGSAAVVTECAGPSLRPASMPVECGQANKAAAVGARGRFVVAVEIVDYREPDPQAADLVDRAADRLREQLDRL